MSQPKARSIEQGTFVLVLGDGYPPTMVRKDTGKITRRLTPYYRRWVRMLMDGGHKGYTVGIYDYMTGDQIREATYAEAIDYYASPEFRETAEGVIDGGRYGFDSTVYFC
jgi:hypothetical protein